MLTDSGIGGTMQLGRCQHSVGLLDEERGRPDIAKQVSGGKKSGFEDLGGSVRGAPREGNRQQSQVTTVDSVPKHNTDLTSVHSRVTAPNAHQQSQAHHKNCKSAQTYKLWYVHIMEYYSAIKSDKTLIDATASMLWNIINCDEVLMGVVTL